MLEQIEKLQFSLARRALFGGFVNNFCLSSWAFLFRRQKYQEADDICNDNQTGDFYCEQQTTFYLNDGNKRKSDIQKRHQKTRKRG